MAGYPIPKEALDDRLAFLGTSGSGKTNAAGTAIERLIPAGARVGIVDPIGVWWGLRVRADGKAASDLNVVIFGGLHADLPLTEGAGTLIGEACATMRESFLIDLSEIKSKAAKRRFMLAFLVALERHAVKDLLHLVLDEADMWAPQQIMDTEGDAKKLLGQVEDIVRRGRVLGFIPWLISQRPAVINKDVLSQADGLVAMKLTSSQDREALGGWIKGSADVEQGKKVLAEMPRLQMGDAFVWIPGREIVSREHFPLKRTFDSSRAPRRGEKVQRVELKPLDVEGLKGKLATIEAEVKANDPKALRTQISELQRKAAAAEARAIAAEAKAAKAKPAISGASSVGTELRDLCYAIAKDLQRHTQRLNSALGAATGAAKVKPQGPKLPHGMRLKVYPAAHYDPSLPKADAGNGAYKPVHARVLEGIWFWRTLGFPAPTRQQVAASSQYSVKSSGFEKALSQLSTMGFITKPGPGTIAITPAAHGLVSQPLKLSARERLAGVLSPVQARVLDACPKDGSEISREDLAVGSGYSALSSGFEKTLSQLSSLGVIEKPRSGHVAVAAWVHTKAP